MNGRSIFNISCNISTYIRIGHHQTEENIKIRYTKIPKFFKS